MNLTKAERTEFERLVRKLGWVPLELWFGGEDYVRGKLYELVYSQIPHSLEDYVDELDFLIVGFRASDDIWERIREEAEEERDQVNREDDDE